MENIKMTTRYEHEDICNGQINGLPSNWLIDYLGLLEKNTRNFLNHHIKDDMTDYILFNW